MAFLGLDLLTTPRRRRFFAGAERGSRGSQFAFNFFCGRVLATEHALRDPFNFLERRHGLAECSERGVVVFVERHRVIPPHPEREYILISENASRHGNRS
jgi:hypothetical protein